MIYVAFLYRGYDILTWYEAKMCQPYALYAIKLGNFLYQNSGIHFMVQPGTPRLNLV